MNTYSARNPSIGVHPPRSSTHHSVNPRGPCAFVPLPPSSSDRRMHACKPARPGTALSDGPESRVLDAVSPAPGQAPPPRDLDAFLAGVERRAFRVAELALGSREDALDAVQEAMIR